MSVIKKSRLTVQCGGIRSFAGNRNDKQRVWSATDAGTEETAGCHVGKRDRSGAEGLRESVPPVYRQCAVCYTDFRSSYEEIFPSERHRPVRKQSGKTGYIGRSDNTMRQRISRPVRKTPGFSEKIGNHIGAIPNFVHYCDETLRNSAGILPLPV